MFFSCFAINVRLSESGGSGADAFVRGFRLLLFLMQKYKNNLKRGGVIEVKSLFQVKNDKKSDLFAAFGNL